MRRILLGFFYSDSSSPPKAKGGKRLQLPKLVSWRDPLEGAFTCPVPNGWKVEGGLKRFTALDVRPELSRNKSLPSLWACSPGSHLFVGLKIALD
jgi:hypothetical protein